MSRRHFRCHARVRLWAFRFVSVHSTEPRAEARTARELPEVAEASEKLCVVAPTGFDRQTCFRLFRSSGSPRPRSDARELGAVAGPAPLLPSSQHYSDGTRNGCRVTSL